MCPACLTAAAWAVAGTTSAGGLTVLVARKFRQIRHRKNSRTDDPVSTSAHRRPGQHQ